MNPELTTDPAANEADLLEQQAELLPDESDREAPGEPGEPGEADPADVRDQRLAVPDDEEHDHA